MMMMVKVQGASKKLGPLGFSSKTFFVLFHLGSIYSPVVRQKSRI